jgi:hypothetical protein
VQPARSVAFQVRRAPTGPTLLLMPVIDGIDLLDLVSAYEVHAGWDPAGGYAGLSLERPAVVDLTRYLLGRQTPRPGPRVPLLGCVCGDAGCWPLVAAVTVTRGVVLWSQFRQPHRPDQDYSAFGPFRFSESGYRRAAETAALSTRR